MNKHCIKRISGTIFKVIVCVFILAFHFEVSSQTGYDEESKTIAKLVDQMFVDMNNKDYDAILEMTHPKVYDIVSKDQMKTMLKSMFEGNGEFKIEIPKTTPKYKLSKIFKEDKNNLKYAFTTYDMQMKMTFNNQKFDDETKKMMVSQMKLQDFDAKFISDSTIDVLMNNRMTVLVNEDTTNNKWVMLNYNPDSPLFYKMLPASVLETAKEYKQKIMLEKKKNQE